MAPALGAPGLVHGRLGFFFFTVNVFAFYLQLALGLHSFISVHPNIQPEMRRYTVQMTYGTFSPYNAAVQCVPIV